MNRGFQKDLKMNDRMLSEKRSEILKLASSRGILNLRLFGSAARGTATETSDIDMLVDVEPDRSMLDVVGFWLDVQDLLQRKVDLVTEDALYPPLREIISAEARPL